VSTVTLPGSKRRLSLDSRLVPFTLKFSTPSVLLPSKIAALTLTMLDVSVSLPSEIVSCIPGERPVTSATGIDVDPALTGLLSSVVTVTACFVVVVVVVVGGPPAVELVGVVLVPLVALVSLLILAASSSSAGALATVKLTLKAKFPVAKPSVTPANRVCWPSKEYTMLPGKISATSTSSGSGMNGLISGT